MGLIAMGAWDVDALVTAVYRDAEEDPADPPGMGALAKSFFRPDLHLVFESGQADRRGLVERSGDEWVVRLRLPSALHRPSDRPLIGYGLARVIAHEALVRWRTVGVDERELADAIVLPTPALRAWADLLSAELAEHLVTTVDLIDRRRHPAASCSQLRASAPLAKAAPSGKLLDLAAVRGSRARKQRSL